MNIDITKTLAYSRTLLSAQALVLDRLQDWLLETWRSEEDFDDLVRSSVSSAKRYRRCTHVWTFHMISLVQMAKAMTIHILQRFLSGIRKL